MTLIKKLDRLVMHPLTVASVLLGTLGSVLQIPLLSALVSTIWHQAGTAFAVVSVSASQGWLPAGTSRAAVAIVGVLFLGRMLDKLYDGVQRRLDK
ncbi:hypothetical protein ACKVMT_07060 [Halobacteriales archaeon Cl-PHB]